MITSTHGRGHAIASLGVLVATVVVPAVTTGYVRTKTCDSTGTYECRQGETPKPISWPQRCIKYRINDRGSVQFGGPNSGLTPELQDLVEQSFDQWNQPECSDLTLVEGEPTSNARARFDEDAGYDGNMNLVVWRDDNWPNSSRTAFALTSVTYNAKTGVIRDADIEINSSTYRFADLESSKVEDPDSRVDLRNTLTHEVGHLVGLDHPNVSEATMYGSAPPGEIQKRTLHEDDISGLCAVYPSSSARTCDDPEDFRPTDLPDRGRSTPREEPPLTCTCSASDQWSSRTGSLLWLLVAGITLLVSRLRRRRNVTSSAD